MKKASNLAEIDNAVQFNEPIGPDHEFFTDFSGVRGDFQDKLIYKHLNVDPRNFTFNLDANRYNKTILFFAGLRGSGKTSELKKYASYLHNSECFFCVTCNIDTELDLNDMEYMDILIFQLEKIIHELKERAINLDEGILKSLHEWFSVKVNEINKKLSGEVGIEAGISSEIGLLKLLKLFGGLKAGIKGSKERSTVIRTTFKNNFSDFAMKFNYFIEEIHAELRQKKIAKEILFIIDGLEKTMATDTRKKIILDEANRLQQIKVNTIFTLPIELMKEKSRIEQFAKVITFPFVKLLEKDGKPVEAAFTKFTEFVLRRIDKSLFDSQETIQKAIGYSGGSPRELLRILEYSAVYSDEKKGFIDRESMEKAVKRLASETSQYITPTDLEKLKIIKENNEKGLETPFDENIQRLLEYLIVFEYNSGSYKRVNPIVAESELYKQYVN